MTSEAQYFTGSATEFHARAVLPDTGLVVWRFDVASPALVLGSRQSPDLVDRSRCTADGIEVVVRRSGGGAVLLVPGQVLWVDVIVPTASPRWCDDVSRAMIEMGEYWAEALTPLVSGRVEVHRGKMETSAWSELVCFDGIGPGEVLLDGAKLVGISQRRTRSFARFQCAVHLHADPAAIDRYFGVALPSEQHRPIAVLEQTGFVRGELGQFGLAELVGALVAALDT